LEQSRTRGGVAFSFLCFHSLRAEKYLYCVYSSSVVFFFLFPPDAQGATFTSLPVPPPPLLWCTVRNGITRSSRKTLPPFFFSEACAAYILYFPFPPPLQDSKLREILGNKVFSPSFFFFPLPCAPRWARIENSFPPDTVEGNREGTGPVSFPLFFLFLVLVHARPGVPSLHCRMTTGARFSFLTPPLCRSSHSSVSLFSFLGVPTPAE